MKGSKVINQKWPKNATDESSSSDELNKLLCETRYRKTTNNNKLLKISNDGRWDAKDKRMTGVAQAQ